MLRALRRVLCVPLYQGIWHDHPMSLRRVFLKEEKVAVVPGTAFGDSGEGFIRISYAYSLENLKVATRTAGAFCKETESGAEGACIKIC